ncbi:hypothetical protein AVEN_183880-1, partial [Araneus ventricosus]
MIISLCYLFIKLVLKTCSKLAMQGGGTDLSRRTCGKRVLQARVALVVTANLPQVRFKFDASNMLWQDYLIKMDLDNILKPNLSTEKAIDVVRSMYGLEVTSIKPMGSFNDQNFYIQ